MKYIILSFIGIAINIWRDTSGTGGGSVGLLDAQNNPVYDAQGARIVDAQGS